MKFLAILSLCLSSLFASVSFGQKADLLFDKAVTPLLIEYTSTGCPGCGSWGKPNSEVLRAIHVGKLNHLEVHIRFNDPMENELTRTFSENRPGRRFTPQFWINNEQATTLTSEGFLDSTMTFRNTDVLVNTWFQNANVPAIDAEVLTIGEKVVVVYGARFYSETLKDKDYYLACYLLRDGLMYPQKGMNGKVVAHNNVLTKSADSHFGKKIDMNLSQDVFLSASFDKEKDRKTAIMIVMWHKNGMNFEAVNSLRID